MRLGDEWISSEASIIGGQPLARAETVTGIISESADSEGNDQKDSPLGNFPFFEARPEGNLIRLLENYSDIFATNPRTQTPRTLQCML